MNDGKSEHKWSEKKEEFIKKDPEELTEDLKDWIDYVKDCEEKGLLSPNIEEIENDIRIQTVKQKLKEEHRDQSRSAFLQNDVSNISNSWNNSDRKNKSSQKVSINSLGFINRQIYSEKNMKGIKDQNYWNSSLSISQNILSQKNQCYLNLPFNQAQSYSNNSEYIRFQGRNIDRKRDLSTSRLISIQDNTIPLLDRVSTSDRSESDDDNIYELLLCKYKDNKRFIKSIKYEDLLLQALSLSESIQTKKLVFEISRESKPHKNPKYYNLSTFKDFVYVHVKGIEFGKMDEFEDLREKKFRLKTLSTINYVQIEHRKHAQEIYQKKYKCTCPNCGLHLKFFQDFVANFRMCMKKKRKKEDYEHFCPLCQKRYMNFGSLDQHLMFKHFAME